MTRIVSVGQFAHIVGLSAQTVYNLCQQGKLQTKRCDYPGIGRKHWLIKLSIRNLQQVGLLSK